MDCYKQEIFALGSILEEVKQQKLKFGNAKNSYSYCVKYLLITRLLGRGDSD